MKQSERLEEYFGIAERVIAIDPSDLELTNELADAYLEAGDNKRALAKLQTCFKADPRNAVTLSKISAAFERMQQYEKAVSVFKELARVHQANGDVEAERAAWESVRSHAPDDADLKAADGASIVGQTAVGTDLSELNTEVAAPAGAAAPAATVVAPVPAVKAAASAENTQAKKMMTETEVYLKYGLQNKAYDHLNRIVELYPDYIPAHEKLAESYEKANNVAAAQKQYRKLIELGTPSGHENLDTWKASLGSLAAVDELPDESGELLISMDDGDIEEVDLPPDQEAILLDDDILQLAEATLDIEEFGEEFILDDDAVIDIIEDNDDALPLLEPEPFVSTIKRAPPALPHTNELSALDDELASAATAALNELRLDGGDEEVGPDDIETLEPDSTELHLDSSLGLPKAPSTTTTLDEVPDEVAAGVILDTSDDDVLEKPPRDLFQEATQATIPQLTPAKPSAAPAALAFDDVPQTDPPAAPEEKSISSLYSDDDLAEVTGGDLMSVDDGDPFADMSQDDFTELLDQEVSAPEIDLPAPEALAAPPSEKESAEPAAVPPALGEVVPRPEFLEDSGAHTVARPMITDAILPTEAVPSPVQNKATETADDDQSMAQKLGVVEAAHGFENDIAASFFPDELEEAEFLIQQDVLDEAKEVLDEIVDNLGEESPRVAHMLARIMAKDRGEPEPPPPWETNLLESVAEELVDMSAEGTATDGVRQVSVDEVLSQFKAGVKAQVDDTDAETHYNLGIAYREMGLFDEAVSEFTIASRVESKAADSYHLIGLTEADKGNPSDALRAFESALACAGLKKKQSAANQYHRGLCLSQLGRHQAAVTAFKEAQSLGTDYKDIAVQVSQAEERAALGADAPPLVAPAGVAIPKKNIDYV